MATYYVRQDGSDANSGLGPATNQAWQTPEKALGATGIGSGDTLWIAPGDYRRATTITVGGTYTTETFIKGDPTASQFSNITPGRILISSRVGSDSSTGYGSQSQIIDLNSKNFMTWENIIFEQASLQRQIFHARTGTNLTFRKCIFLATGQQQIDAFLVTHAPGVTRNILFTQCFASGMGFQGFWTDSMTTSLGAHTTYNFTIDRCFGISASLNNSSNFAFGYQGVYVVNSHNCYMNLQNLRGNHVLRNVQNMNGYWQGSSGTGIIEFCTYVTLNGWPYAGGSGLADDLWNYNGIADAPARLYQIGSAYDYPFHDPHPFIRNAGTLAGTTIPTLAGLPGYSATGTPLTDIFGNPWDGNGTPHIGAFNNYSNNSTVGLYLPTERQVESFTVSPNTTNRSELIYLGAKGLTHTTPSLLASYVRAGAIRTAITLVSQTPNGSWTSGGFCEIDSTNMPGIYRIDVPNAVFVAGAESAMLQLTGTNQTNGAVVHYNMAKVQFDLSQNVPLSNTAHSIGDALNAARAQGFGKWQIVGNTMNIYAEDGITLVKSFALDSGSYPTQRM
jgi:hypothetical protein